MSLHAELALTLCPDACPDVRRVAELHAELFAESWTEEEFQSLLASPAAVFFWLTGAAGGGEEQALGFILLNVVLEEAEILTFGIHPEHRRQGFARWMIGNIAQTLAGRGVERLLLEVDTLNQPALQLYAHCGFETIAIRKGYYSHAGMSPTDAYVMRKKLQAA